MKILTKENASEMLGGKSLDTFVSQLSNRLRQVGGTYSIPRDSGAKTALSRVFAYLLLRKSSVCIYVSGWGVWGSSENLDLFYGYRRSFGESRPLIEAPVHLFERTEEETVNLLFPHHHRDAAETLDLLVDGLVREGAPGLAENLRQFVQLGGFEGSRISNIDIHGPTFCRSLAPR